MATAIEAPAGTMAEGLTSHTQNQADGLAVLRAPFPKEQISALPKILCGDCSRSRTKVCENPRHQKSKCRECDSYITSAHIHLDYVGHAELTHRLLDADPLWDWEPLAFGPDGLPVFDNNGGLWIRLKVCGHSRLGYGDAQGKTGPNAVKEAIGDALRNAAMRFGAALDLWAKSDLRAAQAEHPKSAEDEGRSSTHVPQNTPPRQSTPAPAPQNNVPAAGDERVAQLHQQTREHYDNPNVLAQIGAELKAKNLGRAQVQGPGDVWLPFADLIANRLAELADDRNQDAA